MHRNTNFRKIARVFIVVFLCCEMQSIFTQENVTHPTQLYKSYANLNGSQAALLENSKYQASIRLIVDDYVFGEGHVCGGALIAPSVVLTAARCIYNYQSQKRRHPAEFKVVLGSLDRYQRTAHTLDYGVTHTLYPNSFVPSALHDDVALLWLEQDVPAAHPTVQPIALVEQTLAHKTAGFMETSWGRVEQGLSSNILLSRNVTELSATLCVAAYGKHFGAGMICANISRPTAQECLQGDIGAPLLLGNHLAGIASAMGSCSRGENPVIYTDVAQHVKWIRAHVGTGTHRNSSVWGTLGFLLFTVFALKTANIGKIC